MAALIISRLTVAYSPETTTTIMPMNEVALG